MKLPEIAERSYLRAKEQNNSQRANTRRYLILVTYNDADFIDSLVLHRQSCTPAQLK